MTVPGMKFSLIPKKNRKQIYEYLFKEGVIVVQKNAKVEKHPEIAVPNLHVMMELRSLHTKKYTEERFNWQHHYYFLTNEGIEYLREYLHLPATVFPSTLTKKSGRPAGAGRSLPSGAAGAAADGGGSGAGAADAGPDLSSDWRPRGGFGRGRGRLGGGDRMGGGGGDRPPRF